MLILIKMSNYIFNFGKHKGMPLFLVKAFDFDYYNWMKRTIKNEDVQKTLNEVDEITNSNKTEKKENKGNVSTNKEAIEFGKFLNQTNWDTYMSKNKSGDYVFKPNTNNNTKEDIRKAYKAYKKSNKIG
jgi:hypothetical protein